MSLRDDLESIKMTQTKDYREQSPESSSKAPQESEAPSEDSPGRREVPNPFKRKDSGEGGGSNLLGNKKVWVFGGGAIVVIIIVVFMMTAHKSPPKDQGASFLQDMQQETTFKYTQDQRELLRTNGYNADDIDRLEAEQKDVNDAVKEVQDKRKAEYAKEIKPLMDSASPEYKKLESLTWLGTGPMSNLILTTQPGGYELRYGTYNCDYVKIEPHGAQLFIEITLEKFNNQKIFMSLTPERYNSLDASGNIVVTIEYNKYKDGSILVTNVQEKDISK